MLRKWIVISLFCLFFLEAFGASITASNYQSFVGKKIKFSENLSKNQIYHIAEKKFSTKKYAGKVLTISNIEVDKKGNLILFLSETLDNGKKKIIKIKTKSTEATLENVSVIYPPKPITKDLPKPKIKKASSPTGQKGPLSAKQNTNFYSTSSSQEDSFGGIFFVILCLCVVIAIVYCISKSAQQKRTYIEEVTSLERGEPSERSLIAQIRDYGFPPEAIFHDLYVPTKGGNFSQIDLVLLTRAGLAVFEVKDYSGWLFGNGRQQQWTQVLNYGKEKHRFYNPILQNEQHIAHLKRYLQRNIPFFSIIVFDGNCELKSINFVPPNTFVTKPHRVTELIHEISTTNPHIQYDNDMLRLLTQAVSYGEDPLIRAKHVENIHDMLGTDRVYR